jgi:hypothetical protein
LATGAQRETARRSHESDAFSEKEPCGADDRAGLLASGLAYWLRLPMLFTNSRDGALADDENTVADLQRSSPVTAAGPQRNCTVFPILFPRRRAAKNTQRHEAGV